MIGAWAPITRCHCGLNGVELAHEEGQGRAEGGYKFVAGAKADGIVGQTLAPPWGRQHESRVGELLTQGTPRTFPCLSFLIFKMGVGAMTLVPANSQDLGFVFFFGFVLSW